MARPCLTTVRFPFPVRFSHQFRLERNAKHELRIYTRRQAQLGLRGPFGLSETYTNVSRVEKCPRAYHPGRRSRSGTACRKVLGGPRSPLALLRG